VLDLGTLFAGPCIATFLGEFGADVIKVEQSGVGDPLRTWGAEHSGHSPIWAQEARNKKSITCDLRQKQGQELIKKLTPHCDVIVENYRPGTLERWGLSYENLKLIRPDLIMVRATGYGQTGPYSSKPGFARVGQAFGGLTYLAGEPGGPPLTPGSTTLSDYITPIFGAFGTMLALRHRDRTQQGQVVDVALYETTFRSLDTITVDYSSRKLIRDRTGRSGAPYAAPHGQFPCKDGNWIALACTGDRMWQRFCKAVGRDELAEDNRFVTLEPRLLNRDELDSIVDGITTQYNRDDLLAMFDREEVAAGPVNNIEDIFHDPHYWAREMLLKMTDPLYGELTFPGIVPKLSETPGTIETLGPPVLGQHNHEIYGNLLGLTEKEIDELSEKGVI